MLGTKKRQTRRRKKKALSFFPEVGNEEKKDEKERLETKKKERFKLIGLMLVWFILGGLTFHLLDCIILFMDYNLWVPDLSGMWYRIDLLVRFMQPQVINPGSK
ncbi:uncharacterized protein LOC122075678 isoform X3 [Macadamia integrifolia]|uniref:uncharacterized protein LOC122075678 isoform X3 n=1 Tax=Macadamia integrifolia TaxID=60698 RepID=UPI001C4F1EB0|nr:uncharacterized protein LOC122075678 isoform X3 [Macadamia integrifolia]